ncbi:hypothetical protein NET02_02845 [Thermomicrobiaceae bacterium CFH 74404]|uniref:Uncharacterized protein n=1 Tax=Thermalbibacter longus TaxID=2951981 RepID=A0AA41W9Z0_9BACT|nr:hypothetical protein [Thermalbibacter longus]MCM8748076.1 hypothetical protein [Thermalbibacter longus]
MSYRAVKSGWRWLVLGLAMGGVGGLLLGLVVASQRDHLTHAVDRVWPHREPHQPKFDLLLQ